MFQIILTILDPIFYLSVYQTDAVTFSCCIGGMIKMGGTYGDLEMNCAHFKYILLVDFKYYLNNYNMVLLCYNLCW